MTGFWNRLAEEGGVAPVEPVTKGAGLLDNQQRDLARAEIDAIVARDVFGLTKPELEHVLRTFPTAQRYEEERFGEFRTRRLILEAFDRSGVLA